MIPFDVDIGPYILLIISLCILIAICITYEPSPDLKFFSIIVGIACIAIMLVSIGAISCGSVYTSTITMCAHTSDRGSMTVIDTNQNVYFVEGQLDQFKVRDGATVKVKIEDNIFNKRIYSIDAPIACGNQTCGVST
jgi:hypothetical protein